MEGTKEQHVPIRGQLPHVVVELLFKLIVENNVVFKDEYAGEPKASRFAHNFKMTEQTSISAWRAGPIRGDRCRCPIDSSKASHRMNSVLIKFVLHLLPALQPPVKVDANLVWK